MHKIPPLPLQWLIGRILSILLFICLLPDHSQAEPCTITHVKKGDTFTALCDGTELQMKLYGIKTPRNKQPFAIEARDYTTQNILGKHVEITTHATDRNRLPLVVITQGGFNLNEMLLRNGLAWFFQYNCEAPFCADFKYLENEARRLRIGLWADDQPIAPWTYKVMRQRPEPAGSQAKEFRN